MDETKSKKRKKPTETTKKKSGVVHSDIRQHVISKEFVSETAEEEVFQKAENAEEYLYQLQMAGKETDEQQHLETLFLKQAQEDIIDTQVTTDSVLGVAESTEGAVFCEKCSGKMQDKQIQARSADEPMTTTWICTRCGHMKADEER